MSEFWRSGNDGESWARRLLKVMEWLETQCPPDMTGTNEDTDFCEGAREVVQRVKPQGSQPRVLHGEVIER